MSEKTKKIVEYILTGFICIVLIFFTVGATGGIDYLIDKKSNNKQTAYADTVNESFTSSVFVVPYFDMFGVYDTGIVNNAFPYFQIMFNSNGDARTCNFSLADNYYMDGELNLSQPFVDSVIDFSGIDIVYYSEDLYGVKSWNLDNLFHSTVYYFYEEDYGELYCPNILIHGCIDSNTSVVPVAYSEGLRLITYPDVISHYDNRPYLMYSYRFYFTNYVDNGPQSFAEYNIVSVDFPVEESYALEGWYTSLDINSVNNYIPPMRKYVLSASGEAQTNFNLGYERGKDAGIIEGKSIGRTDYIANELPSVLDNARREGYNDGVADSETYSFRSLLNAVFYAPLHALASMFNFEVLGVNLLNVVTALFALLLISIILKFILGGF